MGVLQLPFASYERFTAATARLVNMYAEQNPPTAKGPITINRIPGISAFATTTTSGLRGAAVWNEQAYAVIGGYLYRISDVGTVTQIGAIAGSGRVSLCAGTYLGIVTSTGAGYTYDGSTLASISDADFPSNARGAAMLDDYMVVFKNGSNQFNASDLSNFTSWNALSFDNAVGTDDNIVGISAGQSKLYIGGERSTEIWWNAGLSPFPFQRIPNGVIDLGLVAQYGEAIIDNSRCWFAHDGTVRILRGLTPQRISTHAVEAAIAGYSSPENAFAMAMTIKGHAWFVLTFPGQGTWVYDFNTQQWHERESLGFSSWNVDAYIRAYNKDLVFYAGKVGTLDETVDSEWSTEIQGQWTYPGIYGQGRRAFHKRFELRADVGIGNVNVTNPLITLDLSDDGGKTWTALPTRSMGKVGEYKTPLVWTRLGSATDRVYRCRMSDPARLHVWSTEVEVDGGRLIGDR